jgi:hypothetical protein
VRVVALVAAVVAMVWIGIHAAQPPAAIPVSGPPTSFSAARAMVDVRTIAMRPHPVASADNARVRAYLAARLHALGIVSEERRYLIDPEGYATLHRWNPRTSLATEIVDLVGVLPGRDRTLPAVAVMAHMDTVWGSPGGADDSAGVAAILELLRAIRARGTPARDIVVLFTDGEEVGLSGARAFWPADGVARHVGVVVNLESRGAGGRATMFETGAGNAGMVALFAKGVAHPVADSMAVLAYRLMPNDTDFTIPRRQGLPGFNFAMLGRPQYYHSPRATADRLDPRTLQDLGAQALGIVSALAFAPRLPAAAGGDAVFFDVAGHGLVHYAIGTGWLIVLAAAAAFAVAYAGVARRAAATRAEVLWGAAAALWLLVHATLALAAFNLLSGSSRHPNYYDRLAALPMLELLAVTVGLAALLSVFMLRRCPIRIAGILPASLLALPCWIAGGPHGLILIGALLGMAVGWFAPPAGVTRWGGWLGAVGLLLLLAIGLQAKAPLAAWIFAWPALVLGIAAAVVAWTDAALLRPWSAGLAAVAAVIVGAPLLPLAHMTFLGVGAPLAPALAPFLLIVAAALWPLAKIECDHRAVLAVIALLLLLSAGVALRVRSAPLAATVPAYALDK